MSRRDVIGKEVDQHGFLHIAPENFHAGFVEDLLRYCLTIDAEEREAAEREDLSEPRFQLITAPILVLIDALWSYHGVALRPFHALTIYRDVCVDGKRYPVPQVPEAPKVKIGRRRYIYMGELLADKWMFYGLRDPVLEWTTQVCSDNVLVEKKGMEYLNVTTSNAMTVNEEGLFFLLEYDLDNLIAMYHDDPAHGCTAGFLYYLNTGMISIGKGQHSRVDAVLRRSRLRQHLGLIWPYERLNLSDDATLSASQYYTETGEMPPDLPIGTPLSLF